MRSVISDLFSCPWCINTSFDLKRKGFAFILTCTKPCGYKVNLNEDEFYERYGQYLETPEGVTDGLS